MLKALPVFALLVLCGTLAAQEQRDERVIGVGGSIDAATDILREGRIEFREGGLSFTKFDDDKSYLVCIVDEHRTRIVLFYSKSTKRITGISAIFISYKRTPKGDEIWAEAKSVTLGDAGSYSIQFLPATPPQPRKSVYPRSKYPRSKPVPKSKSKLTL